MRCPDDPQQQLLPGEAPPALLTPAVRRTLLTKDAPSPDLPLPSRQVTDTAHSDHLVLRRLAVARQDPIRAVDAREAVKAAAAKVCEGMDRHAGGGGGR